MVIVNVTSWINDEGLPVAQQLPMLKVRNKKGDPRLVHESMLTLPSHDSPANEEI